MTATKANPEMDAQQAKAVRMLAGVLELLDRHGVAYCIPHGHETYPDKVNTDVDMIVDPQVSARDLQVLLHEAAPRFGARLVRCRGRHLMLALRDGEGPHAFLTLDIDLSSEFDGVTFFTAKEMLGARRRERGFWIPAVEMEFGHYLARSLARGRIDPTRTQRLQGLFHTAPQRCRPVLSRLLDPADAAAVLLALQTGDWAAVATDKSGIRRRLLRRSTMRHPVHRVRNAASWLASRAGKLLRPDGLTLVALGPDGAGKSSTTEALAGPALMPVFDRSVCQGFVPPLHRLLGRNHGPSSEPHALPPRPVALSLFRCGYWLLYSVLDQARVRLTTARGGLVLYDRHVVDVLVDQQRYRYDGPRWPIKLIWKLIPKPDMVVSLTAPAAIIQARKQEVPFEVTERQLRAYAALANSLPYGHVVDASRPFSRVIDDINELVLCFLAARIGRRLGRSSRKRLAQAPRAEAAVIGSTK